MTKRRLEELKASLPYQIVDLILEDAVMHRMEKVDSQTPEFRLICKNVEGSTIKAIRKMIEEVK